MKYYEPKHFIMEELVPPEIYNNYGNKALRFLDKEMLMMIDGIREFFGEPISINNWKWGGQFSLRGFRPLNTGVGALYSQHKFGRAADMDIRNYTAEEARKAILDNQKSPLLNWVRVIEDKVNWLHCDCRNIVADEIAVIQP
jgi:hypothetical protein